MLAYYPNRDSLHYLNNYDVPDVRTFMRATLRHPSFCKGWDALIRMGLTNQDDTSEAHGKTTAAWVKKRMGFAGSAPLPDFVAHKLGIGKDDKVISMLNWLGLFDDSAIAAGKQSSADILLGILLQKWKMEPSDKDLVVMQHEIEYTHKERKIKLTSTMSITGDNRENSAMAKTVGMPMAVLANLVMNKKITPPVGVLLPTMASVYRPILTELVHYGIVFKDEVE